MTLKELMEEVWRETPCKEPNHICRWLIGGNAQATHIAARKGRPYEVPKRPAREKRYR